MRVQVLRGQPGSAELRGRVVLPGRLRADAQRPEALPGGQLLPREQHVRAAAVSAGQHVGAAVDGVPAVLRRAVLRGLYAADHAAHLPRRLLLPGGRKRAHAVPCRLVLQHRISNAKGLSMRVLLPCRIGCSQNMPCWLVLPCRYQRGDAVRRGLLLPERCLLQDNLLLRDLLPGRICCGNLVSDWILLPCRSLSLHLLQCWTVLQYDWALCELSLCSWFIRT